jgi:hypothetical protein
MTEDSDQWVYSSEAAAILGIPQQNFLYYVKSERIEYLEGEKQRDRKYRLSDIYRVRKKLIQKKRLKKGTPEPLLIDWSRIVDVPVTLKLDQQIYPDEIDLAELAVYQAWRKNETRLSMVAFSQDRTESYGYIQLIPLQESTILDILKGKRTESSITPDEILPYDKPGAYTLLAISAVAHPDRPDVLLKILNHLIDFWVEQYPERYITRVYAQVVSESGDRLVQHMFMAPRYDLAKNAYMLDLARPGASKAIRIFQRRLAEKAPLPPELTADYSIPVTADSLPSHAPGPAQPLYRFAADRPPTA